MLKFEQKNCVNPDKVPLVVTTGEPSGIGPEISIKAAFQNTTPVVLVGDRHFLEQERQRYHLGAWPNHIDILHVPLPKKVRHGKLNIENAKYVLRLLNQAHQGLHNQTFRALVTAPLHKGIINDAGIPFTGHTEYLQKLCQCSKVVMMLVSSARQDALRVALVTTHLPIRDVAQAITYENVRQTIRIVHDALSHQWKIQKPRIVVTGLNPHAGEGGHLGTEEIETIIPVLESLRHQKGYQLTGPLPADTAFIPSVMKDQDAFVCMYHDQGLTVLKHIGFAEGVNITLGLPYIRTSPDHGTAHDIAGLGIANFSSQLAAMHMAQQLSLP